MMIDCDYDDDDAYADDHDDYDYDDDDYSCQHLPLLLFTAILASICHYCYLLPC